MNKNFTSKKSVLAFLLFFSFLSYNGMAQSEKAGRPVKKVTKVAYDQIKTKTAKYSSTLVACGVDLTVNGVYPFLDAANVIFNGYLCGANDSVSGTVANGYAFYNGDGYSVKLIQGSQVTFSVGADSCAVHPVSLTICDSTNTPIPGAYVASGCPNSINFTAPYTGVFIVVMNENGICAGGGTVGIGEIFCYKQTGTTLPVCLGLPVNDEICGAISLTVGGAPAYGDISLGSLTEANDADVVAAGFACSTPNNTLWYSYTAATTQNLNVIYESPAFSGLIGWLGIFDAATCTDPLAGGVCNAGPVAAGAPSAVIPVSVVAGTTYYFMIDGNSGATGTYGISLEVNSTITPANDSICGATSLILDGPFISGNTADAAATDANDAVALATDFGTLCSTPNNTEWFEFTPAATDSFELVMSADGLGFSAWIAPFSTASGPNSCQGVLTYESTDCINGTNNTYATGVTGVTGDTAVNRFYLLAGTTYYFMIDGYAGATGQFSIAMKSVVAAGVNEFESNIRSLSVYPNPVKNELNINYNLFNTENINFQLVDLTGRVLLTDVAYGVKNGKKTINVKDINNGIYMLRLSGSKGNSSRKIMIQR